MQILRIRSRNIRKSTISYIHLRVENKFRRFSVDCCWRTELLHVNFRAFCTCPLNFYVICHVWGCICRSDALLELGELTMLSSLSSRSWLSFWAFLKDSSSLRHTKRRDINTTRQTSTRHNMLWHNHVLQNLDDGRPGPHIMLRPTRLRLMFAL